MKKVWIIVIIAVCVVILAATGVRLFLSDPVSADIPSQSGSFAVNEPDTATGLSTAKNFSLFTGDGIGFSFLHPANRSAAWKAGEGAYIYCGEEGEAPYVLIFRTENRGMTPEKYFKACNKLMLDSFENVQSTPINEVVLGEKTLYLVRYVCDGHVIDRYVELYRDFYIEYTSISDETGSLNTELYYAITTLRVNEGAYSGAFSDSLSWHRHDLLGIGIDIPDMLELKDLTIGYFASCEDAVLLALWITEDDSGNTIYNRQEFIDRAAESPDFVSGLLGADSASFTEGKEEHFGETSFYCYPMEMRSGDDAYAGRLCLANAGEKGCWLLCYAVREGCPDEAELRDLIESCIESVDFENEY